MQRNHHVGWFDVAVDDAFLMGVLDGLADRVEEFEPFAGGKVILVAILGDRDAANQFHHEIRSARVRGAGVEHLSDIGVLHHGQGLALGFKAGDDLFGVHPQFDDFQRNLPFDGLRLFGHVNDAHPAFADSLEKLVSTDLRSGTFRKVRSQESGVLVDRSRFLASKCGFRVHGCVQEVFNRVPQLRIALARVADVDLALLGIGELFGGVKNRFEFSFIVFHGCTE